MSKAKDDAIRKLNDAHPEPVVLHVRTGGALVKEGIAVQTDRTGCGQLHAEYRKA